MTTSVERKRRRIKFFFSAIICIEIKLFYWNLTTLSDDHKNIWVKSFRQLQGILIFPQVCCLRFFYRLWICHLISHRTIGVTKARTSTCLVNWKNFMPRTFKVAFKEFYDFVLCFACDRMMKVPLPLPMFLFHFKEFSKTAETGKRKR